MAWDHQNKRDRGKKSFAMNGATLLEIAEALGHKTLAMVKIYAHLCDSHKDNLVSQMNAKIFGETR